MKWKEVVLAYPAKCTLEISEPYALFSEGEVPIGSIWPSQYPHSERRGVYLIFSKAEVLLYVGKAAKQQIGNRLGTYFSADRETGACRVKHPVGLADGWTERPTYIVTIAVPDAMGDEASKLEEYLIKQLQPCDNTVGILRRMH
jgi:hypothetical protein